MARCAKCRSAIEVFHRNPSTYDPKSDPIVRVNVSRSARAAGQALRDVRSAAAGAHRIAERPLCAGVCRARCAGQLAAPRFLVLPFVSESRDDALATLLFESTIGELQAMLQVLVLGRVRHERWPTMSRSIRRGASTRGGAASRIVRSRRRRRRKSESQHVHTDAAVGAVWLPMLASKRYSRTAEESDAGFIDRVSRQIREDSLRALAGSAARVRIHAASAAQRFGCVARGGGCLRAVASSQRTGHSGRHREARRLESAIDARRTLRWHAYLAATMGNLDV